LCAWTNYIFTLEHCQTPQVSFSNADTFISRQLLDKYVSSENNSLVLDSNDSSLEPAQHATLIEVSVYIGQTIGTSGSLRHAFRSPGLKSRSVSSHTPVHGRLHYRDTNKKGLRDVVNPAATEQPRGRLAPTAIADIGHRPGST
ncbi:hypothetical protein LTR23_006964, partial [Exophiala sp. CCFEE 6169]